MMTARRLRRLARHGTLHLHGHVHGWHDQPVWHATLTRYGHPDLAAGPHTTARRAIAHLHAKVRLEETAA